MTAKNQCRNPDGRRSEPFCYTLSDSSYSTSFVEEECAVSQCPPNFYPEYRLNTTTTKDQLPPLVDSLTNVWRSLSSQWQLAFVSGFSGFLLISFIFLICCIWCCCRNKSSQKQHRKGSQSVLNGGNSATTTIIHNLESGSSVISNNKKGVLGIPSNSINGGSSMANSDINNAYYRKTDRINDEALNPLLNYGQHPQFHQPQHLQQQFQQQMFEMQQQQNFPIWDGYSGIGYPQQQFVQPQQHFHMGYMPPTQSNTFNNNSPHTSAIPAEPYQITTIQEEQVIKK